MPAQSSPGIAIGIMLAGVGARPPAIRTLISVPAGKAFLASGLTLYSGFGLGTVLLPAFALFFPVEVAVAQLLGQLCPAKLHSDSVDEAHQNVFGSCGLIEEIGKSTPICLKINPPIGGPD